MEEEVMEGILSDGEVEPTTKKQTDIWETAKQRLAVNMPVLNAFFAENSSRRSSGSDVEEMCEKIMKKTSSAQKAELTLLKEEAYFCDGSTHKPEHYHLVFFYQIHPDSTEKNDYPDYEEEDPICMNEYEMCKLGKYFEDMITLKKTTATVENTAIDRTIREQKMNKETCKQWVLMTRFLLGFIRDEFAEHTRHTILKRYCGALYQVASLYQNDVWIKRLKEFVNSNTFSFNRFGSIQNLFVALKASEADVTGNDYKKIRGALSSQTCKNMAYGINPILLDVKTASVRAGATLFEKAQSALNGSARHSDKGEVQKLIGSLYAPETVHVNSAKSMDWTDWRDKIKYAGLSKLIYHLHLIKAMNPTSPDYTDLVEYLCLNMFSLIAEYDFAIQDVFAALEPNRPCSAAHTSSYTSSQPSVIERIPQLIANSYATSAYDEPKEYRACLEHLVALPISLRHLLDVSNIRGQLPSRTVMNTCFPAEYGAVERCENVTSQIIKDLKAKHAAKMQEKVEQPSKFGGVRKRKPRETKKAKTDDWEPLRVDQDILNHPDLDLS
jgi:hypothetical protein